MASYQAPIRDMQFVLHELLQVEEQFSGLPGFEETTADVIDAILEEGAKLCENIIVPTNRIGDEQGCRFDNGNVTTPDGFKEAYKKFMEGGWAVMGCDEEYGGQPLPKALHLMIEEIFYACNCTL